MDLNWGLILSPYFQLNVVFRKKTLWLHKLLKTWNTFITVPRKPKKYIFYSKSRYQFKYFSLAWVLSVNHEFLWNIFSSAYFATKKQQCFFLKHHQRIRAVNELVKKCVCGMSDNISRINLDEGHGFQCTYALVSFCKCG